jgi:hypothetical protein
MSFKVASMSKENIRVSEQQIVDFCRRWKITEFALFCSVAIPKLIRQIEPLIPSGDSE